MTTEPTKICAVCMPVYPTGAYIGPVVRLLQNPARTVGCIAMQAQSSLLAHGFNLLWCRAMNARRQEPRICYFAMLHADVEPVAPYWLDALIHELESTGADMVSAVVPIKSQEGLTSTAVGDSFDPWCPVRRLTMTEVMALPQTFDASDVRVMLGADKVGYGPLLVNTGCFVLRMDREWAEQVFFTIRNRIVRLSNGDISPEVEPEDWHLSRLLDRAGATVLATRKVPLMHHGVGSYTNDEAWGQAEDDAGMEYTKQHREPVAY